ncbi:hypothetical protein JRI60_17090 [Archangium violaceum]|uniref:hypothetical protein n=1 Tax=Archangium violaceum TaxID=83451 RepID=UPI00194E433C|nr:hypothetical protein [Archangium violaceum]QRO00622.1 hypothetical protein JRI60_17090 [Archangium violaceum]
MSHKRWYTRQAVIIHQGELTPEERARARNPSELRSFFTLSSGTEGLRDWQLEEMAAATGAPQSRLTDRNSVRAYVLRAFSNGQLVALRRTNEVASLSQSHLPSAPEGVSSGQLIGSARVGQTRSTETTVLLPQVMSSPAVATMAKARPEKQSDFVINVGQDAFVVSFELLPDVTTTASVRVVVSPADYSRAYQSQPKYWDGKGREVDRDERWKTMGTWSVPAAPFTQTIHLGNRANFDPIDLERLPEKQATVWTFDLNNDGKPDFSIRVSFSSSNITREYDFTTYDNRNVSKFGFHFIQNDAWKYEYQGNWAPRRKPDDFIDFLGDIFSSKTTWEIAITSIPVIGEIVLLGEAVTEYSIFGDKLSAGERVIAGLAALLPVAAGILAKGVSRTGANVAKVAAKLGRSEEEVIALLRAAEKQSAEAANVERWQATLKAGGKLTAEEVARLQRILRQVEADNRVFRAAEQELGLSRILRRGGKVESTGPVTLKRLRIVLGNAGVSPSGYRLRKVTKAELESLKKAGVDPSTIYAWVSRDANGALIRDARGRPVITFTEKGLSSLGEAVKSFGHEAKHIKDFAAGMITSSEALAERAGEELWALVKKRLVR